MFWKLVFANIEHRPIRAVLSTLLIAVPVTLLLTMAELRPVVLKNASPASSASAPPLQRLAPANPLVAVSFVYCFGVILLSMHGAVLQRTAEIGVLRFLGASRPFVIRIVLAESVLFGVSGAVLGMVLSQSLIRGLTTLGLAASRDAMHWESWLFTVCGVAGAALLGAAYRRVSTTLRQSVKEFTENRRLLLVC